MNGHLGNLISDIRMSNPQYFANFTVLQNLPILGVGEVVVVGVVDGAGGGGVGGGLKVTMTENPPYCMV